MRIDVKRRIVLAGLAAITVWPMVHHVLVRVLDITPWKLFGWSMYCEPPRRVMAFVHTLDDGAQIDLGRLTEQQRRAVMGAYERFGRVRAEFGSLVRPDDFGRVILRAYPMESGISIDVVHLDVDRASATVVLARSERYEYRR